MPFKKKNAFHTEMFLEFAWKKVKMFQSIYMMLSLNSSLPYSVVWITEPYSKQWWVFLCHADIEKYLYISGMLWLLHFLCVYIIDYDNSILWRNCSFKFIHLALVLRSSILIVSYKLNQKGLGSQVKNIYIGEWFCISRSSKCSDINLIL